MWLQTIVQKTNFTSGHEQDSEAPDCFNVTWPRKIWGKIKEHTKNCRMDTSSAWRLFIKHKFVTKDTAIQRTVLLFSKNKPLFYQGESKLIEEPPQNLLKFKHTFSPFKSSALLDEGTPEINFHYTKCRHSIKWTCIGRVHFVGMTTLILINGLSGAAHHMSTTCTFYSKQICCRDKLNRS